MTGKPSASTKPLWIPYPSGGINLLAAVTELQPNEALALTNFYVGDNGLYQIWPTTNTATYATQAARVFGYTDTGGLQHLVTCADFKIYVDSTDETGAAVITTNQWQSSQFNGFMFLTNGVDAPLRINVATKAVTAAAFTGVTGSLLIQSCNYKSRLYAIENTVTGTATNIWYSHDPLGVTGALDLFPIGGLIHNAGSIAFITSWGYNQGLSNDELFVIVMNTGEVLVYSGEYPGSADWKLAARTSMPIPAGNRGFRKLGQDVLVATQRGLISLAQVFAGRKGDIADEVYYSVSRKLGPFNNQFDNCEIALDDQLPLLYMSGNGGRYIFVLNYESGAWSIWQPPVPGGGSIGGGENMTGMVFTTSNFYASTDAKRVLVFNSATYNGATPQVVTSIWQTPFFNYDSDIQKNAKLQRALYTNTTLPYTVALDWRMNTLIDYAQFGAATYDIVTKSAQASDRGVQEFAAPGTGRSLSYNTICASTNLQQLLLGMWTYVDQGGVY